MRIPPRSLGRALAVLALTLGLSACCRHGSSGIQSSSGEPQIQTGSGIRSTSGGQATVDFGEVPLGQRQTLTLELGNIGIATLGILSVDYPQPDPEFTVDVQEGAQIGSQPLAIPIHFVPFTTGPKSALVVLHTDSTNFPTVTLKLQGTGVKLVLSVVPEAIDFGQVLIHTTAAQSLAITNASAEPLTLALSAIQGAQAPSFTVGALPSTTLAQNQTVQLPVSYSPATVAGVPDTAYFTIGYCPTCNAITVNLRGEPVDTGLVVSPDPMTFGFVPQSASVTKILKLHNIANRTIALTTTPILDTGYPAAAYAFGQPQPTFPATIPPNGEVDVPIVFTPSSLVEYKGSLTFTSSDPLASQLVVPLDGFGGGAQLSCLPSSLAFGPSPDGVGITQRLLCTNVGQDVPGHPEGNLLISALTVPDDKSFAAHFDAPFPIAGLTAGQSATVDVVYTAAGANVDLGHLHLTSNDATAPDTVVPLSGTGVNLPPCDFALAPQGNLSFGVVRVGKSEQLPFAIENLGASDCLLNGLGLAAGSDPAFTLPAGPIASQLLSYPGNPAGAPSELEVQVNFAPLAAGNHSGDVTFTVSNPSSPHQDVRLVGTSGPSCLVVVPGSVDFGTAAYRNGSWVSPPPRTLSAYDICSTDLHVTALTLVPGIGGAHFSLAAEPTSFPQVVAAGGAPLTFEVAFQPQGQGPESAVVSVQTQELATPYLVPLQGDAEEKSCSLQVTPSSLDFGPLPAGSFGIQQLSVTNVGTVTCEVSALSLSALTDPAYSLGPPPPPDFALDAGSSATVAVTFTAPSVNFATTNSGDLLFNTNDPSQPNVDVPLTAGVEGPACPGNFPNLFTGQTNQGGSCHTDADCVRGLHCGAGNCSLDGTDGPLQVVLSWDYGEDLDLHVVEPSGCEDYYGNPSCAGTLNYDAWAACSSSGLLTLEQVTYPVGTQPPTGVYTVRADFYEDCDSTTQSSHPQIPYVVQIRIGSSLTTYCGIFTPGMADSGQAGSGVTVAQFTVKPPGG